MNVGRIGGFIGSVCLCAGFASPALAELESTMSAVVVSADANGIERYYPATRVKPGQTVEYRIVHVNSFDRALDGVAVVGPVPASMEFVRAGDSTDIPAILEVRGELNPDRPGEEWSGLPATKIVIAADGAREIRPATGADFTAVRWRLTAPLPQRSTVRHTYRTQVK